MKPAFDLLTEFVSRIGDAVNLNKNERKHFREAVGGFADEIDRGLTMVVHRIRGGITIAKSTKRGRKQDLIAYQQESAEKLLEHFREFRICDGLRAKRDHLKQLLHPAKFAIDVTKSGEVKNLLACLEHDEYVILDEVGDIIGDLHYQSSKTLKAYVQAAEAHITTIERRRKRIRDKARKVLALH